MASADVVSVPSMDGVDDVRWVDVMPRSPDIESIQTLALWVARDQYVRAGDVRGLASVASAALGGELVCVPLSLVDGALGSYLVLCGEICVPSPNGGFWDKGGDAIASQYTSTSVVETAFMPPIGPDVTRMGINVMMRSDSGDRINDMAARAAMATIQVPRAGQRPTPCFRADDPPRLRCPLSGSLMWDPVVTAAGGPYERAAMEAWLRDSDTDPRTGVALNNTHVCAALDVRAKCDAFSRTRTCVT